MCGRFTLGDPDGIAARFGIEAFHETKLPIEPPPPRFNIAPSQDVAVVVSEGERRALRMMHWGYQPRWLSTPKGPAPINARAETLGERPLFRGALASGRCLIPADGYYEWVQEQGRRGKQPYWLHLPDRSVFGFAGIWTTGPDDVATCAIVTTAAHPRVARLHPRMPVILSAECEGLWLDAELRDPLAASACLTADMGAHLEALPVSPLVSSVRNDGPQLLLPLT